MVNYRTVHPLHIQANGLNTCLTKAVTMKVRVVKRPQQGRGERCSAPQNRLTERVRLFDWNRWTPTLRFLEPLALEITGSFSSANFTFSYRRLSQRQANGPSQVPELPETPALSFFRSILLFSTSTRESRRVRIHPQRTNHGIPSQ